MPRPAGAAAWLARGFVFALAACRTVERFGPGWLRPDWHAGDMAQHVWWTARFADPSLFPGDFIADFFSLPLFAPLGYQAIYRLFVPHADPQTVAETIPFFVAPLLVWLCWRLGRAAGGGTVGAVVAACTSLFALVYVDPGLPRGFALPLLALGMVGLLERRPFFVGVAALGAALLYPPIAVNLGATTACVLGADLVRRRGLPAGWPWLAVQGALALAVVLHVYAEPLPEGFGPPVTAAEARAMPEFHAGGRSEMFAASPLETWLGPGRLGYGLRLHESAALFTAVIVSARLAPGVVPLAAWALLGTAVLAHALACATLFALHLPARYMEYSLPIFVALWLAALAGRAAARARARHPWLERPAFVGAVLVLALAVFGSASLAKTWRRVHRGVYTEKEAALAYVRTLPRDALIAAHPTDANSIPLRTRRSVLASKEVALPYQLGYYRRVAERIDASLRAFYAEDWDGVDALFERYGVDVMVVFLRRFRPGERSFTEPFATRLAGVMGREPSRYVLARPPKERTLFRDGDWVVVRLGPPRPGYGRADEARRPAEEAPPPSQTSPAAAGTR